MSLTKSLAVGTAVGTFGAVVAFAVISGARTDAAPAAAVSRPQAVVSTTAPTAKTVLADCVAPAVLEHGVCVTHLPGPVRTIVVGTHSSDSRGAGSYSSDDRSAHSATPTAKAYTPRRTGATSAPTRPSATRTHHEDDHSRDDHARDDHARDHHDGDDHGETHATERHETEKPESPETDH